MTAQGTDAKFAHIKPRIPSFSMRRGVVTLGASQHELDDDELRSLLAGLHARSE